MPKLLKIYNCYGCSNIEYISKFDKWYCILTENEIDKPELINNDCPLDDAKEE